MTGDTRQRDPVRQPIFNVPGVIAVCCALLLAIYGLYASVSLETRTWVIAHFAFVPARMAIALDLFRPALRVAVQGVPQETFSTLIGSGNGRWWTLVTHALLHGSLVHVGSNCIWFVVFGSPVARRFGTMRLLVLLLTAVIVGALFRFLWNPVSFVPIVGASAAVAGAAGAAVRFIFSREARGAMFDPSLQATAFRQPAMTLAETFTNRAGLLFILLFLGSELLLGLVPELAGSSEGRIVWQGHIGGFLTGLLLFPVLDPRRPTPAPDSTDKATKRGPSS